MTVDEYEDWTVKEVESYAVDIAESSGIGLAEARQQSSEQTAGLLPDGLATPGVHLLRVLDPVGVPAGILWIGRHPRRPNAGWVYDIVIDEQRRGEGLGRAAMFAAEEIALREGWTALGLNVFGHNSRARALYESLGYEIDSMSMTKVLTT